jgi:hypothetical protein
MQRAFMMAGFTMLYASMMQDDEFIFNNFRTAAKGNVLADFGLVAFDGDASSKTDSVSLVDSKASVVIADQVNPDNNIANSTISVFDRVRDSQYTPLLMNPRRGV